MGNTLGSDKSRQRQKEIEQLMDQLPPDIDLDKEVPFRSWWIFSVMGALVAVPFGIKRKSLAPLVLYGTTGTLLDVFCGIEEHERKRHEWMRDYVARHSPGSDSEMQDPMDPDQAQEMADPWLDANKKKS